MDHALLNYGLPVRCRVCLDTAFVRPRTDYDGWYKSQLFRRTGRRWFCHKHAADGKMTDDKFYQRYATPEPVASTEEELYKLLD